MTRCSCSKNPQLVSGGIAKGETIDADKALETMGLPDPVPAEEAASAAEGGASVPEGELAPAEGEASNDPMKALEDSMKKDAAGGAKKP